jgi:hypothetical protein
VHLALAEWYCGPGPKRGREPAETWAEYADGALSFVRTTNPDDETMQKYVSAEALGIAMLEGYRALYGRDEHMHVIAPERTVTMDVPWPQQEFWEVPAGQPGMAEHVTTFDLVWRDLRSGRIKLEEHKTAGSIYTGHLELDDQGGTYWAVATTVLQREGLLKAREFIDGIEYNFLRKALPDERPVDAEGYHTNKPLKADYVTAIAAKGQGDLVEIKALEKKTLSWLQERAQALGLMVLGERSKIQPAPLFLRHNVHRTSTERRSQMLRLQNTILQMELHRAGSLPIIKNPTRECRFCPYYDICELEERGGDWQQLRDIAFIRQDPYESARKSTDE